ncbi:hypothetical protein BH10PAT3_BH10PAT3_1500 [soil metagenome]
MKALLIGNRETSEDPEAYYSEYQAFFKRAANSSKTKPEIEYTLFEDLIISVGDDEFTIFDTRHKTDISSYQLILIRGKAFRQYFDVVKSLSTYAKLKNVPVVNDYSTFRDSSKLTQALQFYELNIPVAKTVFVTTAVLEEKAPLGIEFPCIMKATHGAHGNDNYLVKGMAEAKAIAERSNDINFVMQRFVPNNKDYRLLVAGSEVLVIGREAVDGSHLNNTSQGGSAQLATADEVPIGVIEDAKKVTAALGMTFSGVDVLADKNTGKFYFLEVNSQPQLMSGAFIDKKVEIIGRYFDTL